MLPQILTIAVKDGILLLYFRNGEKIMGLIYLLYDPTYVLVLLGALISIIASVVMKIIFSIYNKQFLPGSTNAYDVCNAILRDAYINDVAIGHVHGNLSDHYNPTTKTLNLSDSTYRSSSIAAIGVAAHECGHALQHADNYWPLKLRMLSVPVANIGSWFSWPVLLLGVLLDSPTLATAGVYIFLFVVGFQLITLPVEINASRRAVKALRENCIMTEDELAGVKKVLFAAAMTYVAALAATILQLLRLMLIAASVGGRRRR